MDWSDIAAFKQCSTFDLEPWQCELLILMSRTYCVWLNKGKEMDCFSPWDSDNPRDIARHQEYLAKKLKERRKPQ